MKAKGKVLLHICCGVCCGSVVEKLRANGYEVTGYFYNPNIHPREEYDRRLAVVREAAKLLKFALLEGVYDDERWFNKVKGLEGEKEGGRRCLVCYQARLLETSRQAREYGMEYFATTLSVSPHKDVIAINKIGSDISPAFLQYDFKKEDGFKKTMEFAKEHEFYRQNYCGCKFSIR